MISFIIVFAVACVSFSHTRARVHTQTHTQTKRIHAYSMQQWCLVIIVHWHVHQTVIVIRSSNILNVCNCTNWHKLIGRICMNARTHTHTDRQKQTRWNTMSHTPTHFLHVVSSLSHTQRHTNPCRHTHLHTQRWLEKGKKGGTKFYTLPWFFFFFLSSLSLSWSFLDTPVI